MIISTRQRARQNLLVAAVNAALDQNLITLECEPVKSTKFEFNIGPYSVIAAVHDAGFDEVGLHVIACPTDLGREFVLGYAARPGWQRYGEAATFAWLERRDGKYLQSGVNYHGTKTVTAYLGGLSVAPLGYGTKPTKEGYDWHKECERVFGTTRRAGQWA